MKPEEPKPVEPKSEEENMAMVFATIYRMSQLLNLPVEDCARIYIKCVNAVGDAFKKKVN
jgi:hypothetical protein